MNNDEPQETSTCIIDKISFLTRTKQIIELQFRLLRFGTLLLYKVKFGGGGQPDSDMKVDFAEIGIGKIGKIGISDYFSLKYRFLATFGKIGNKNFFGISYFSLKIRYSYPQLSEYPFLSLLKRSSNTF